MHYPRVPQHSIVLTLLVNVVACNVLQSSFEPSSFDAPKCWEGDNVSKRIDQVQVIEKDGVNGQ